jgi:hypothetical protein
MTEGSGEDKSISSELSRLGQQVADAINAAWASEDRKKLQSDVTVGLRSFGDQVSEAMRKASESEAAKQVRDQTEKVVVQLRESDVTDEVRKGLIAGLDVLNRELGRLVEKLETPTATGPASQDKPVGPGDESAQQAGPQAETPPDAGPTAEA